MKIHACTACRGDQIIGFPYSDSDIGQMIACPHCGHAMLIDVMGLRDLTHAEASAVAAHENFPIVRAIQEQMNRDKWG